MLNTDRFKDLSWVKPASSAVITLGGTGGIGSWAALFMARAGFPIIGYDYDIVEEHNLGGQLFAGKHVDMPKTDAIKQLLDELAPGNKAMFLNSKMTFESDFIPPSSYVVAAFDNMAARKGLFKGWCKRLKEQEPKIKDAIFIDGRMRAEGFQLYVVINNPASIEAYEKTLFNDKDVPDDVCTIKATSHNGAIIGALINAALANNFADSENDPRSTPFKTIVDLELFNFDVS